MELYCFSSTGNSRRAAETARRACGTTPIFLAVFPVHAQTIPDLVRAQLQALPPMSGPACVLCTYGGVSAGSALRDAASILTGKDLCVIAAAELPDRHSYESAVKGDSLSVPRRWSEKDLTDFLTRAVQKASSGGAPARLPRRRSLGKYLPQRLLAVLGTRYPAAEPSRCTGCGRCAAHCPTGAANGKNRACIRCAACVSACPTGARTLRLRTPVTRWYLQSQIRKAKTPAFYL